MVLILGVAQKDIAVGMAARSKGIGERITQIIGGVFLFFFGLPFTLVPFMILGDMRGPDAGLSESIFLTAFSIPFLLAGLLVQFMGLATILGAFRSTIDPRSIPRKLEKQLAKNRSLADRPSGCCHLAPRRPICLFCACLKIKINTVAISNFNQHHLSEILKWCGKENFDMTIIEVMPMGDIGGDTRYGQYLPLSQVRAELEKEFTLKDLPERTSGPARYVSVKETNNKLGFITVSYTHLTLPTKRIV